MFLYVLKFQYRLIPDAAWVIFQGTEIQLGLALESQNATLSVKRRLACEAVSYYAHVLEILSMLIYLLEITPKSTWQFLSLSLLFASYDCISNSLFFLSDSLLLVWRH